MERGSPANSHKSFSRNDGPASKAASYVHDGACYLFVWSVEEVKRATWKHYNLINFKGNALGSSPVLPLQANVLPHLSAFSL